MKNLEMRINDKLSTLSTVWDEIKVLNEEVKATKVSLFLSIEADIKDELIKLNDEGEIKAYRKQAVDFIDNMILGMDAKTESKKIKILELLSFTIAKNIAVKIRVNKKGATMYLPLGRIEKIKNLGISNSQIKKATDLFIEGSTNKGYVEMINNIIEHKENQNAMEDEKTAIKCGIKSLSMDSMEDMEAVVRHMKRKIALKKKA